MLQSCYKIFTSILVTILEKPYNKTVSIIILKLETANSDIFTDISQSCNNLVTSVFVNFV